MRALFGWNKKESPYDRDFLAYGQIGGFGGFEQHIQHILGGQSLLSDHKYRANEPNRLGPVFVNRSLRGHIHPVIGMGWSPSDPDLLASVGKDSRVMVWNIGACTKVSETIVAGGSDVMMSCALSPDNHTIACGGVGAICYLLSRNAKGDITKTDARLDGHEGFIPSCAFLSNSTLLTASGDATCKLWDLQRGGNCAATFEHSAEVMSVAPLSGSDGTAQQFYSAHGTTISLWDTRAAPCTPAATVASSKEGDITSLSVCKSKDFLVACGTESGDSWVYDFRTPAPICRAACIDSQITQEISSVAFSHTGSYVFAGYRKWVKNYMDCVMAVFDVSGCCGSTSTSTSSGSSDEPQLAPHCVIGSNPGITSSAPFTYSYQPSHDTFVSAMGINSDGCALAAASHGGTIAIFRQQH